MLLPDSFLNFTLWNISHEFVFSRVHSLPYIYSFLVDAVGVFSWLHFLTETILADRKAEITANRNKPIERKKEICELPKRSIRNCPGESSSVQAKNP